MGSTFVNRDVFIDSCGIGFFGCLNKFDFIAKGFHFAKVEILLCVILIGHVNAQIKKLIAFFPDPVRNQYMEWGQADAERLACRD